MTLLFWGKQNHGMQYFSLQCFDTVGWATAVCDRPYSFSAEVKGTNCYKSAVESTVTCSTSSKCLLVNVLAETKTDDNDHSNCVISSNIHQFTYVTLCRRSH